MSVTRASASALACVAWLLAREIPAAERMVGAAQPESGAPSSSAGSLKITLRDCPRLDRARIERLLWVELASLAPDVANLPELQVQFACDGDEVRVGFSDLVTHKWLERSVVLPPGVDAERTLAIAASELFLASWAELLVQPAPARSQVPEAGVDVVETVVEQRAALTRRSLAIDGSALGRVRHLDLPVITLGAGLRMIQVSSDAWQLAAQLEWETATIPRQAGNVVAHVLGAGVGLRARLVSLGDAAFFAAGIASSRYFMLRGTPVSSTYFGATHGGFTADFSAELEMNMTVDWLRFGSALGGGLTLPGLVGRIDGEAPVRLDGPWVGARVHAGFLL